MARSQGYNSFNKIRDSKKKAGFTQKYKHRTMGGRGYGRRTRSGTPRKTRNINNELLSQLTLMEAENKKSTKVTPTKDKTDEDEPRAEAMRGTEGPYLRSKKKSRGYLSDDDSQSENTMEETMECTIPETTTESTNIDKPPCERPVETKAKATLPSTIKKNTLYVKLRQIIGKNSQEIAEPAKVFKLLFARIMSLYKDVIVMPHEEGDEIVSSVDIPLDEKEFKKYATNIYVSASGHLHMLVKMKTETPLWQIKRNEKVMKYLYNNKIFLEQQKIASTTVVKLGGLLYTHNQLTHRDTLVKLIQDYCKQKDDDPQVEIQLTPYTYYLKNQNVKIFTRLLAVECDKAIAMHVRKRLMHMFSPSTDTGDEAINKLRFFPFQDSGAFDENLLRKLINKQNTFLNSVKHVIIYNMADAYWSMNSYEGTFARYLMKKKSRITNNPLIHSAEKGSGGNKVVLIIDKRHYNEVIRCVHDVIQEENNILKRNKQSWLPITASSEVPSVTKKDDEEMSTYASLLFGEVNPQDCEKEYTPITTPAKRQIQYENSEETYLSKAAYTEKTVKKQKQYSQTEVDLKLEKLKEEIKETISEAVRSNRQESTEKTQKTDAKVTELSEIQEDQNLLREKLNQMLQQSEETKKKLQQESDETNELLSKLSLCHEAMIKENQTRDRNISTLTKTITETNQTLQTFRTATNKSLDNIMTVLMTIRQELGVNKTGPSKDIKLARMDTTEDIHTQPVVNHYQSPQYEMNNPAKKVKTSAIVQKITKKVTPPANNGMSGGGAE